MTDALTRLADAVEAGRDDSEKWYPAFGEHGYNAMRAFHGSLDAAKSLHEAVLPDWVWFIGHLDSIELGFTCTVSSKPFPDAPSFGAFSDNPARAWLLAVIKALGNNIKSDTIL